MHDLIHNLCYTIYLQTLDEAMASLQSEVTSGLNALLSRMDTVELTLDSCACDGSGTGGTESDVARDMRILALELRLNSTETQLMQLSQVNATAVQLAEHLEDHRTSQAHVSTT
jgi:hypothetical protein